MKRTTAHVCALMTVLCFAGSSFAQGTSQTSIEQVIQERISKNPDVILSGMQLESSNVGIEKLRVELKELKKADSYSKRDVERLESQIYYDEILAKLFYEESVNEKKVQLRKAFYDYAYNSEKLRVKNDSLRTAENLLAQAKTKLDTENISQFDYEQVEISLNQKKTEYEYAKISVDSARHTLNILLGEEIESDVAKISADFAMEKFEYDELDVGEVLEGFTVKDYSLLSKEKTAKLSSLDYEKLAVQYTDINMDARIQKIQAETDEFNLEQAQKILRSEFIEGLANLKISVEEIENVKYEMDYLKKKYDAKTKEYELGHASLNELDEEYSTLESKTLEYYEKIYSYNVSLMNFKEKYKLEK